MLTNCPECKKEMSDTAPSCPHCGYVTKPIAPTGSSIGNQPTSRKSAVFQCVSLGAIAVALFTPRILVTIPCLVIISAGILALVRKEPRWLLSLASTIVGFLMIAVATPRFDNDTSYVGKMTILQWNYTGDYNATDKYIHIKGRVRNDGGKTVSYFKVKALFKDEKGNVLDTDYTNSGDKLSPGMSKEFEIMHKDSSDYRDVSVHIEEARTD